MISKLFHSCHVSPRWAEGHVAGHRRCKRRQDLDGYQYIEPTWNDVVEYTYIYIYWYVSKYTSVDLCFLYIIHSRKKMPCTYYACIYYLYCLSMFKTWLCESPKKWRVIRHLTTCVVATLQDRYQTSTTSVGLVQSLHRSCCPSAAEVSNSSGWQWPSAAVWPKCNPGTNSSTFKNCVCYHPIYVYIRIWVYVCYQNNTTKTDSSTSSATIQSKNCLRMRRRARSSR